MLFILLSLFYGIQSCFEKVYTKRKWELEDGRTLYLNEKMKSCFRPPLPDSVRYYNIANITDGTNAVDFTKASGKVKLADGRTAYIGDDNYLRIIGSNIELTETFRMGRKSRIDF
ncbi:hypothetical protein TVAG_264110 [Trichomonas vaginalis G3]|uniref:Uncharacterized protein n=1 Tax=Trichomonas vaginalis (strain ATCC PRA-98 / G3) TaxID=412133 RepID=A2FFK8_TRIV3|nr:hypothetical protein TVAGG3_1008100 [Trichomonas vaginalis G3]EAX96287.1 hypothetical protein TVAG_264110 [Trichomonas vaginalis G3]KAI5491277.1 hypothetical protein TVAGG3_1008100 [Trichomonas vaginalis G3]|eukprot:XP_001309217.1 hypothetical protein [Trichomonas vaginalis G3]